MTLGPLGTVTHAVKPTTVTNATAELVGFTGSPGRVIAGSGWTGQPLCCHPPPCQLLPPCQLPPPCEPPPCHEPPPCDCANATPAPHKAIAAVSATNSRFMNPPIEMLFRLNGRIKVRLTKAASRR